MAHAVIWPKKTFFYPIGNTTPVCFTQNLSPEKSAYILLLGCGDPRSILYTVYADLAHGNRLLDFTCCDWEPAILARNILLLTMIVDGVSTDAAWSIFYHFFLDESSHNILIAQCRTLLQASSDMKTWKDSKYGRFTRFCTEQSLSEIRRHWNLYSESKNLSRSEHRAWKASFHAGMQAVREDLGISVATALRATGPLFLSILKESLNSHSLFWTTGVTKTATSQTIATPYVNPTFGYSLSGKKFNVHYGTDPIAAFCLAPAFESMNRGNTPTPVTTEKLVNAAKAQFSSWCQSFKTRLSSPLTSNFVIRFFVGESLAFCRALHICREQRTSETGIYAHPWGGSPIALDAGDYCASPEVSVPLSFNVIDTSNLTDHIGLLNLLIVTVPLLDKKPWSVLYTNTLLRPKTSGPIKSNLSACLLVDIPTLSMLLGVAPSSHLWHFSMHSDKHECLMFSPSSPQLHETISWRFVSSFIPNAISAPQNVALGHFNLLCDSEKLAEFFFSVYLKMFADESIDEKLKRPDAASLNKQIIIHYVRESFVGFLALVKGRVRDWSRTMSHLVDLIACDRSLLMGLNNYQDLMCYMFLYDVYTQPTADMASISRMEGPHPFGHPFHLWKKIPPVVCVVLKIPRQELKFLEDMTPNEIQTPMLHCITTNEPSFANIHSSIQLAFGDIAVSVIDGEPEVTIKEDPKGWSGSSSLIATFYMPSWILTIAPASTQVGLHIRSTPKTAHLASRLGMLLTIYSASLTDTSHIQVVRHRPSNSQEILHLRNAHAIPPPAYGDEKNAMLKFDPSGKIVTHLIIRKDITDPIAMRSLASGSEVSVTPVTDSSILATFGGHAIRFAYPFPVQIKHLRTRIARKSSYIEVESPIRSDFSDSQDLSLNPFAVAYDSGDHINLLNVHYLNLKVLPALKLLGTEKDIQWLTTLNGTVFSHREAVARRTLSPREWGPFVNLKESIGGMLIKHAEMQVKNPQEWSRIFGLYDPDCCGFYALIFVNDIKFDLASHSVVIDACVVPLIEGIRQKLRPALDAVVKGHAIKIITFADEIRAWRLLLPALAERCRVWKHTSTCEYRTQGIPASLEGVERSPLCSCGKGKNLGQFGTIF